MLANYMLLHPIQVANISLKHPSYSNNASGPPPAHHPVVNQQYSVIVHDEYVMSGNTAILKCVVRFRIDSLLHKCKYL